MFKVRTGVQNSSWAGEGPQIVTFESEDEFRSYVKQAEENAKAAFNAAEIVEGQVVFVDTDSDGVVTVYNVVEKLVPGSSLYENWRCKKCRKNEEPGCASCNDGFISGEDRFIHMQGEQPFICLARYYEPEDSE